MSVESILCKKGSEYSLLPNRCSGTDHAKRGEQLGRLVSDWSMSVSDAEKCKRTCSNMEIVSTPPIQPLLSFFFFKKKIHLLSAFRFQV